MLEFGRSTLLSQVDPRAVPLLAITVDTEEEFDWQQRLSKDSTRVTNVACQVVAQRVFERYGVRPTYLVDFPVASQPNGYLPLRDFLESGVCDIGAHLHPWVNPPYLEDITDHNSYPGNLPRQLEHEKLEALTSTIGDHFGVRPTAYRAGRYGFGRSTASVLRTLRYEVDTSVVAWSDFSKDGGPDFSRCPGEPYWIGPEGKIMEVPNTAGFAGLLAAAGARMNSGLRSRVGTVLHLPGVFARTRLFERIRLTPEGTTLPELCRLTRALLRSGQRAFVMSYHSPSLSPGKTPYTRTVAERAAFLDRIEGYLDFFCGEISGQPATLSEIRQVWMATAERLDGPMTA